MALKARDVMQTHVITVEAATPLVDVQRLFVEEEIGGAPVVDETGRVLGVISASDLLRAVEEEHAAGGSVPNYFYESQEFSGPDWTRLPNDFQDRLAQLTAADAMSEGGFSVSPDASVPEVAHALRSRHIHRVLVVDDAGLCGIISTFDLVALLEKQGA